MKKLLLGFALFLTTTAGFAKFTPTSQERQSLYQAVESTLYTDTTARVNLLMLVQGYAYQNVDDITKMPLESIKIYNLTTPDFYKCVSQEYNAKKYKKDLDKGLDYYFNQVNKEQFTNDLNYLMDKNRQNHFNFMKDYYNLMAENNALIARMTQASYTGKPMSKEDEETIKSLQEQVQKQSESVYDFMAKDLDDLLENHYDHTSPALTELMGLSLINMPFDEQPNPMPALNPLSVYQQSLLDKCHQNYWKDIHSGKIPL